MARACMGCRTAEGELHAHGCTDEECPFCGGQLVSCECIYDQLGLRDPKLPTSQHQLPQEVFDYGPAQEHEDAWRQKLEAKGRLPYKRLKAPAWTGPSPAPAAALIELFGRLYPESYRSPPGAVVDLPPVVLEGFGSFLIRVFRPIDWEDAAGDPVVVQPRLALAFEPAPALLEGLIKGVAPAITPAGLPADAFGAAVVSTCKEAAAKLVERAGWVEMGDIARARAIAQWQRGELRYWLRFQVYDDLTEKLSFKFARLLI